MEFSRSKEISSTTDEVRVKFASGSGRQVLVGVISGTFVGTIKFQTSDDGKTWTDGTVIKHEGTAGNPTGVGTFVSLMGASAVAGRIVFSAYTSGAARIRALSVPLGA